MVGESTDREKKGADKDKKEETFWKVIESVKAKLEGVKTFREFSLQWRELKEQNRILLITTGLLVCVVVFQLIAIVRLSGMREVVVIPQTVWYDFKFSSQPSPGFWSNWAIFFSHFVGNINPQNIEDNMAILRRFASPSASKKLDEIERDFKNWNVSQTFHMKDIKVSGDTVEVWGAFVREWGKDIRFKDAFDDSIVFRFSLRDGKVQIADIKIPPLVRE